MGNKKKIDRKRKLNLGMKNKVQQCQQAEIESRSEEEMEDEDNQRERTEKTRHWNQDSELEIQEENVTNKIGQKKKYLSVEEKYKAQLSNDRRVKSEVIQQIHKQLLRLKKLQVDPVTAVVVLKDVKKNRKRKPKYMGIGELFEDLKKEKPLLTADEMKRGRKFDLNLPLKDDSADDESLVAPCEMPVRHGVSLKKAVNQNNLPEQTEILIDKPKNKDNCNNGSLVSKKRDSSNESFSPENIDSNNGSLVSRNRDSNIVKPLFRKRVDKESLVLLNKDCNTGRLVPLNVGCNNGNDQSQNADNIYHSKNIQAVDTNGSGKLSEEHAVSIERTGHQDQNSDETERREEDSSTSPHKIGQRKIYTTEDDEYKAKLSNDRRVKSEVIQQIHKQLLRLKKLQVDPVTAVVVLKDVKKNKKSKPKYMGVGDLFEDLKKGKPLLTRDELKKGRKFDLNFPSKDDSGEDEPLVTPCELPFGRGILQKTAQCQTDFGDITKKASTSQTMSVDVPMNKESEKQILVPVSKDYTSESPQVNVDNSIGSLVQKSECSNRNIVRTQRNSNSGCLVTMAAVCESGNLDSNKKCENGCLITLNAGDASGAHRTTKNSDNGHILTINEGHASENLETNENYDNGHLVTITAGNINVNHETTKSSNNGCLASKTACCASGNIVTNENCDNGHLVTLNAGHAGGNLVTNENSYNGHLVTMNAGHESLNLVTNENSDNGCLLTLTTGFNGENCGNLVTRNEVCNNENMVPKIEGYTNMNPVTSNVDLKITNVVSLTKDINSWNLVPVNNANKDCYNEDLVPKNEDCMNWNPVSVNADFDNQNAVSSTEVCNGRNLVSVNEDGDNENLRQNNENQKCIDNIKGKRLTPYLKRIKKLSKIKKLKDFKKTEALRMKEYRSNLSEEQKETSNQLAKLRMRKYRERLKAENKKKTPKTLTYKEAQEQEEYKAKMRKYWREKKQQSRAKETEEQKELNKIKRKQIYKETVIKKKLLKIKKEKSCEENYELENSTDMNV